MHALGTYRRYNARRGRFTAPSFYVPDERRLTHSWVIGKTGVGKSTFLANSILQDIRAGNGIALFDPHGDLAETVLSLFPPARRKDVIYFNPADADFPLGFNPLAGVDPDRRPVVISTVTDALHSLWPDSWGPAAPDVPGSLVWSPPGGAGLYLARHRPHAKQHTIPRDGP